jgi:dipeptidyl aminopeptidase/acylaminoacyl peptidase
MKTLITVILSTLIVVVAFGQVTLENLMGAPFPSSLVSSRDGKRIAWVFTDKGVRNIWIADAPQFKPVKLTNYESEDGQEIGSLFFNREGDKLFFTRGGAPNTQNELPNPLIIQEGIERAIWQVSDDREMKKLAIGYYPKLSPDGKTIAYLSGGQVFSVPADGNAEGKRLFSSRGNQNSITWSPDGEKIAFVSTRQDHSFVGVYNLKESKVEFLDPSIDHDDNPIWSGDSKAIAYIRMPNVRNRLPFAPAREGHPWSIRMLDVERKLAREIWSAQPGKGSVLYDGVPAIDKRIFWIDDEILFPWERDGWIHYYSVSVKGGEAALLTPGDGEVEQAAFSADRKGLIYSANLGDINRRHLYRSSVRSGSLEPITKGTGIEWNAVETEAGIVCIRSEATSPAWLWIVSQKGELRMLASELFPGTFPGKSLITPQAVTITASDGMKIPGQLFMPASHKPGEKHPAILYFHGGSRRQMLLGFHYSQYYHHAYALNQFLANQGYIVLSVNYRSGIGYGLDFREAIDYGATGASEFNDVRGAGEFLKQRDDVDPARIALWGASYGGYLTALGLTRAPELFSCGVDIHGVHDWNVVIKNFVPSYQTEKHKEFSQKAFESSPINYIKSWKAPVLLIHGDDDRNVPFSETVTVAEYLRDQNVYFEQLVLTDEVHSFLLHDNWLKAYRATADFFRRQFSRKPGQLTDR